MGEGRQGLPLQGVDGGMGRVARMGGGQAQGLPLQEDYRGKEWVTRMGEGRHKACPYRRITGGRSG